MPALVEGEIWRNEPSSASVESCWGIATVSDPVAQLIFLIIKAIVMPVLIILIVAFAIFFERSSPVFFAGRWVHLSGTLGSLQSFATSLS